MTNKGFAKAVTRISRESADKALKAAILDWVAHHKAVCPGELCAVEPQALYHAGLKCGLLWTEGETREFSE